jgi:hypothetical protein
VYYEGKVVVRHTHTFARARSYPYYPTLSRVARFWIYLASIFSGLLLGGSTNNGTGRNGTATTTLTSAVVTPLVIAVLLGFALGAVTLWGFKAAPECMVW